MPFSSFAFIFLFLPPTLLGFYCLRHPRAQLTFLLVASIVFYCQWSAPFSLLMLFTVCFDFYVARAIAASTSRGRRKALLVLSVATNLGILGFFKYYGLFSGTWNELTALVSTGPSLPTLKLVLPIGISFYTFQSMSYVIDVYRGDAEPHGELLPFAGYVTMFPHQISGPLVRHDTIVPQLQDPNNYVAHAESFWRGLFFFVVGLAKKVLIADRLGAIVSPTVASLEYASQPEAILAMLGYTMQLYFDFSGYSDMAVGLGRMLNIRFPQNFNSPYRAVSLTDFWRRWHMTLSSWLRDYVYISLGGNRRGAVRAYVNVMITMLLGGLWHGASWTFAFWGFLHGTVLCLERLFHAGRQTRGRMVTVARWAMTFVLVNLGWVFFRSPDFPTAFLWLRRMFLGSASRGWDIQAFAPAHRDRFLVVLLIAIGVSLLGRNTFAMKMRPSVANAVWLAILFGVCLLYLHEESPFLYFQF